MILLALRRQYANTKLNETMHSKNSFVNVGLYIGPANYNKILSKQFGAFSSAMKENLIDV
jgi:hypothetical protein